MQPIALALALFIAMKRASAKAATAGAQVYDRYGNSGSLVNESSVFVGV